MTGGLQMSEEEKWQFVPDKECYYCRADLELYKIKEKIVTKCPRCERSFTD